jgi:mannitol-1-phosphate 5-dehydrogenase
LKAVIFGAGNIGRGFLGQLFHQSGCAITFVDVVEEVIERINSDHSFPIRIVSDREEIYTVDKVNAIRATESSAVASVIASANIMGTAVGVNILPRIAPAIAAGLKERFDSGNNSKLNIIICENIIESGKHLKSLVLEKLAGEYHARVDENIGFVAAVVSRMVPALTDEDRRENPVQIKVEPYCVMPVDKPAFRGKLPAIEGLQFSDNLFAYEERKLFTHNAGHAICAYFGYQKGYTYIYEAITDSSIRSKVFDALMESGGGLIQKHGFTPEEHREHIEDLFSRFANVALGDTVARVGRDPLRKLGFNDRLIGSARIAIEFGIEPVNLVDGICAALNFDNPDDETAVDLQRVLDEKGIDHVLSGVCGLSQDHALFSMIKQAYLKKNTEDRR